MITLGCCYMNKRIDELRFLIACRQGWPTEVERLIDKVDINTVDDKGDSGLFLAINHISIVELLINNGADPNSLNEEQRTPLMIAAKFGYRNVMDVLLKKGAKIDACDRFSQTALFLATHSNDPNNVELLIKKGANVNHQDFEVATALIAVCEDKHEEIALLFYEN